MMTHPDADDQKIPVPLATGLGNRLRNITCVDAVTDLRLLRHVDRFVGTKWSTFSALAPLGRAIPATMCVGDAPELPPAA
jgi:hypothetical protein